MTNVSKLVKHQVKLFNKDIKHEGCKSKIGVKLRYDDECGNGYNTFSITASIWMTGDRKDNPSMFGCLHDEITKHFPELAHLIKWHLVSSDSPMHYVSNALYHASDRDHYGLLKGEKRQLINGKTKLPHWRLVAIDKEGTEIEPYYLGNSVDAAEKPECHYTLEYRPWCRIGEGKAVELGAARHAAIWPDAELEDFTQEKLEARLPALMSEFKAVIESIGFEY